MNRDIKVTIVDGVGINLKTSIMNELAERGHIVVKSDSSYYQFAKGYSFPYLNNFAVKAQCRFMEIMTAVDIARTQGVNEVYVDRGIINQVVWSSLNHDNIVDDYGDKKDEHKKVIDNFENYLSLENSIRTNRVLLETHNEYIVDKSLDPNHYDFDPHTAFRIDTFYDLANYRRVQEEYIKRYGDYTGGDYFMFPIPNDDNKLERIIMNLCDSLEDL